MPEAPPLADISPAELAQAVAWRTARFGARQSGRALRRLPSAATQLRALAPKGPIARLAERGYSIWSADSRFCIASVKSLGSAWSVWSLLSAGSAGSLFSLGSVLSVGSAGSILSIGSAGSILSIGSVGSVCSIGAAGQLRRPDLSVDPEPVEGDAADGRSVIDHGATLLGLLALGGAVLHPGGAAHYTSCTSGSAR